MRAPRQLLPSLLAVCLSGCASHPGIFSGNPLRDRYEAPQAPHLGTVVARFPSTQSIVVEQHPAWSGPLPAAGRTLESRSPENGSITARLELARPRRHVHLSAIVLDGEPRIGDDVFLLPNLPPANPPQP